MQGTFLPVLALVLSSILWAGISKKLYRVWFNPISTFAVLSLFHNWIGSVIDLLGGLEWAGYSKPYARAGMLLVNLGGLWAFSLGALMVKGAGRKVREEAGVLHVRIPPAAYFEGIYWGMVVVMYVAGFLTSHSGFAQAYGAVQTLSAPTTSSLTILLLLRLPALVIGYTIRLLMNQSRPKSYLLALAQEILLAFLTGSRKQVMMVLVGLAVAYVSCRRVRVRSWLRVGVMAAMVVFLTVAVGIWRSAFQYSGAQRSEVLSHSFGALSVSDWLVEGLMGASSEGVQSWAYGLWFPQGFPPGRLMYGKTYFQALVNTFVPRQFQGGLVQWQAAFVFKEKAYAGSTTMGYDFSFSAESILNFGLYLSFIPFLFLGLWMGWLYSRWRNTGSLLPAGCYLFTLCILSTSLRTDAVALFRFMSLTYIPAWFIFRFCGVPTPVSEVPAYQDQPELWSEVAGGHEDQEYYAVPGDLVAAGLPGMDAGAR